MAKLPSDKRAAKGDVFARRMGCLMHLFKNREGTCTKARIFGLVIDIAGIVLLAFGAACLDNALVGVADCRSTGLLLTILGPCLLFCGITSVYILHYWEDVMKGSSAFKNVARKRLWVFGEAFFVIGIVLVSVGWACAKNSLAGIEACPRRTAIITLIYGAPTFTIGFIAMILSFIYENKLDKSTQAKWGHVATFLKAMVKPHEDTIHPLTTIGLILIVPGSDLYSN